MPDLGEEQRNVRNLIRIVGAFIAWPSLSIGLVMAIIDFQEHLLHILGLVPLGAAALVLYARAPRLAVRFVPDEPATA